LREIVGDLVDLSDVLTGTLTLEDHEDREESNGANDFNTDWSWQWLMVEFGPIIREISPVIARFYREESSPPKMLGGQDLANVLIERGFTGTLAFIWRHIDPAAEME
jgi:hypothetical protein